MRCKGCNNEMNNADHLRKDPVDDSFVDLCGPCYRESEGTRYGETVERLEDAEEAPMGPQDPIETQFLNFVIKHDLMTSWAEGLGLRWTPKERQDHFYDKCLAETIDLITKGHKPMVSMERACGVLRADRRREQSGASYGWAPGDDPTDGYVSTGNLEG